MSKRDIKSQRVNIERKRYTMSSEDEGHPCGAFGVVCGHLCAMFCFETCCACFVPSDVPFRPHDLSVVFLDYVLKRPSGKDNKPVLTDDQSVVSVEAKGFGTGDGLLSQMYRLKLTYSPSVRICFGRIHIHIIYNTQLIHIIRYV